MIHAYLAGAHQHLGLFADADRWARRVLEFGTAHNVLAAQASGYEFLGEDSIGSEDWKAGLEYAEKEREIAARLHSRERRAWAYIVTGWGNLLLDEMEQAEREFRDGIELAGTIGERRLELLLIGGLAYVQAERGRLDEALATALTGMERAEEMGLLYMRTEARRCLAHVRFRRGELDESIRLCETILGLTAETDAKVSRLWTGPLHIEALLAAGRQENARQRLTAYQILVAECQSPHFDREVDRLRAMVPKG